MEVLERIKDDPQLRTLPVVVLTSSREEQDLVRSYDLGTNAYVVKPVDFKILSRPSGRWAYSGSSLINRRRGALAWRVNHTHQPEWSLSPSDGRDVLEYIGWKIRIFQERVDWLRGFTTW